MPPSVNIIDDVTKTEHPIFLVYIENTALDDGVKVPPSIGKIALQRTRDKEFPRIFPHT